MTDEIPINATRTTFRVVEAVSDLGRPTFGEVVEALDMPKSTVHDYLRSLETAGYVVRAGDRYRLSSRFLQLGELTRHDMDIYDVAVPYMDNLAADTGERLSLVVEENGLGALVYGAKSNDEDDMPLPGTHTRLHTTASGKAILSTMSTPEIVDIVDRYGLPEHTSETITSEEALLAELDEIREIGHSFDRQERFHGLHGVGAPVEGAGDLNAAVALYGPASRLSGERFTEEIPARLKEIANIIEVNINFP
jgi:DNA-binding IclR family transcriptional regulator